MHETELEQELQEILSESPDALSFGGLRAVLDCWPSGPSRDDAVREAECVLKCWPDSLLKVEVRGGVLDEYLRSPSWPLVRHLRITDLIDHDASVLDRPEFAQLQGLEASRGMTAEQYALLTRSPSFANVTKFKLGLFQCRDEYVDDEYEEAEEDGSTKSEAIYDDFQASLRPTAWSAKLKSCCVPSDALTKIAGSSGMPLLEEVAVFFPEPDLGILTADRFPKLRILHYGMDDSALFAHLEKSGVAAQLRELYLSNLTRQNDLGRLGAQSTLSSLRHLSLASFQVSPENVQALSRAPFLPQLHTFELQHPVSTTDFNGPLDDKIWKELTAIPFRQLEHLIVRTPKQREPTDAEKLADAPWLSNLKTLRFNVHVGPSASCIVPRLNGEQLRTLDFRDTNIGNTAVFAICENKSLTALDELRLDMIDDAGLMALTESNLQRLERFDFLSGQAVISESVWQKLAQWHPFRQLRHLDLSFKHLNDSQLNSLLSSAPFKRLRHLSLMSNPLTDAGIEVLAKSKCLKTLWHLNLTGVEENMSDTGLRALAESENLRRLHELYLRLDVFSVEAESTLANSPRSSRLEAMWLIGQRELWAAGRHLRPILRATAAEGYPGSAWEEDF